MAVPGAWRTVRYGSGCAAMCSDMAYITIYEKTGIEGRQLDASAAILKMPIVFVVNISFQKRYSFISSTLMLFLDPSHPLLG